MATTNTQNPVNKTPVAREPLRSPDRAFRFLTSYGLLVAWAIVILVFSLLQPDIFPTTRNLQTILSAQGVLLILTLALLPSLAAGELDLSVAGMLGLSFTLIGWLNVVHGWPIGLAVAVALLAGLLVGVTNAGLIVWIGVDSFVTTLGMGTLLIGIAIGLNAEPVSGVSSNLVDLFRAELFGVQAVFYYGLALTVLLWYVFSYTPLGRYLFVVGAGRNVAILTGIRVQAIRSASLITASVLAAVGGVALAGVLGSSDSSVGSKFLLPAFAAAFLGSTTIKPGRFNPWGAFAAVYFLATGITGLQLEGLSGWIEQVFYGGSLIIAVVTARVASRRVGE